MSPNTITAEYSRLLTDLDLFAEVIKGSLHPASSSFEFLVSKFARISQDIPDNLKIIWMKLPMPAERTCIGMEC